MPALLGETGTHIVSDADFAALQANGGTRGVAATSPAGRP
jgi:hypothetical protein